MAKKKMARRARRRTAPGVSAAAKPVKLTRSHIVARDHKDLSTHELECRIEARMDNADIHDREIERLQNELKMRRAAARMLREDVAALEALVEGRR